MEDRASPRPKVAAHVTGSFVPKLEGGGEWSQVAHLKGHEVINDFTDWLSDLLAYKLCFACCGLEKLSTACVLV